ncbi:hypothetical protein QA640_19205 [Bradyrhizobium sp. CB82]|uniref:hypothetical protein n=1 Tax=Bradyrhizobium sp. CB82 TaxID=3039159 RepID=UPI0024B19FB2|nr:hypothetical protein [Bradyrhizobium sp. CB82]WFU44382.1 hypothetical protein QA640_19205 [Bradyrhizobium sp. CB82]
MDYFSEDSAHVTHGFSLNDPSASTCEDGITRKRWAKAVLAFYICLFFLGGATSIGVYQSMTMSGGIEQHATLRTDIRSTH